MPLEAGRKGQGREGREGEGFKNRGKGEETGREGG